MSWFNLCTTEASLQSVNLFEFSPRTPLAEASDSLSVAVFLRSRSVHMNRCRKMHPAVLSAQKMCFLTQQSKPNHPQSSEQKSSSIQTFAAQLQFRTRAVCVFSP